MRKLSNDSKVTLIYKIIRDNIATGRWCQDDQFSSFEVAKKYGIGRTTVNDAIKVLEKNGFVTILPNVGFRINALQPQGVKEYFEVRLELEKMLTRHLLAAANIDQLNRIKDRLKLALASYELQQFEVALQGIEEFHLSISEILESSYVQRIFRETEDMEYFILSQLMVYDSPCYLKVLKCKEAFVDAVMARDRTLSMAIVEDKCQLMKHGMIEILEKRECNHESS